MSHCLHNKSRTGRRYFLCGKHTSIFSRNFRPSTWKEYSIFCKRV